MSKSKKDNADPNSAGATGETVRVRLLTDSAHGKAGAAADIPADELEGLKAAGAVDDSEAAVAYAEQAAAESQAK